MDKNIKKVEFEVGVEGTVISVSTDNETDQCIRLSDKVKYDNQEYTVGQLLAAMASLMSKTIVTTKA